jgi:hypothetical protein
MPMQRDKAPGQPEGWAQWFFSGAANFFDKVGQKGFYGSIHANAEIRDGVLERPEIRLGAKPRGKDILK